ncbi:hypothetical protein BER2_1683 [plant metagenome]|uniref:DUF1566 domain-containing protein n=1 Tax=plant metagenome TaxID=1297885 RepID=A0A484R4Z7_9ZZZZ
MNAVATQTPAINQPWPEQGGIYIGSRLIDGQTHHILIPGGTEHDIKSVEFAGIDAAIETAGEINGFSDWRAPDQEDLMLAYINARERFERSGWGSMYWSRTPSGSSLAWVVGFEYGHVHAYGRGYEFLVRPFRSVIA